jgi:hypothetical protein
VIKGQFLRRHVAGTQPCHYWRSSILEVSAGTGLVVYGAGSVLFGTHIMIFTAVSFTVTLAAHFLGCRCRHSVFFLADLQPEHCDFSLFFFFFFERLTTRAIMNSTRTNSDTMTDVSYLILVLEKLASDSLYLDQPEVQTIKALFTTQLASPQEKGKS